MNWKEEAPNEEGLYWITDGSHVWVDDLFMWDGRLAGRFGNLSEDEYNYVLWGEKIEAPEVPTW